MDRGDAAGPDAACVAAPRSQCLPSVSHGVSKRSGGARTTKSFAVSAACHVRSAERRSRYDGIVRSSQAAFQPPSQAPDYDRRRNCSRGMKRGGSQRISPSCRSWCGKTKAARPEFRHSMGHKHALMSVAITARLHLPSFVIAQILRN